GALRVPAVILLFPHQRRKRQFEHFAERAVGGGYQVGENGRATTNKNLEPHRLLKQFGGIRVAVVANKKTVVGQLGVQAQAAQGRDEGVRVFSSLRLSHEDLG